MSSVPFPAVHPPPEPSKNLSRLARLVAALCKATDTDERRVFSEMHTRGGEGITLHIAGAGYRFYVEGDRYALRKTMPDPSFFEDCEGNADDFDGIAQLAGQCFTHHAPDRAGVIAEIVRLGGPAPSGASAEPPGGGTANDAGEGPKASPF